MVERVIRTKNHPKQPNTFEILRAQAKEPKTTHGVQDWLDQAHPAPFKPIISATENAHPLPPPSHLTRRLRSGGLTPLPLQSTEGNRLPPLTRVILKRKMPDSSSVKRRESPRKRRNTPSALVDSGHSADDKEVVTREASKRRQKPASDDEEDATLQDTEGWSSLGKALPGRGRLEGGREMPDDTEDFPAEPSSPSKTTNSRSKKSSSSPSKKLPEVTKRERMKFMSPRILFRTVVDTKEEGYLGGKLAELWKHMNRQERNVIPSALKKEIQHENDTPMKTKPSIPNDCFGSLKDRYTSNDHAFVHRTVKDVCQMAGKYRHTGCTEAHWTSVVVSPLLNLVRQLGHFQKEQSQIAVLDLTTVEISPSSLCPTSQEAIFKDLDKRIDAAFGLDLPAKKQKVLEQGVYSLGIPSINQTASFVNFTPMFANFEVKRPLTNRDPLIQLGTWIAAEFEKRKREGYSLDMPVLAVEIDGDAWELHLVFALEDIEKDTFECNFAGPISIGSTKSILGIYQILDKLCLCAEWGIGKYQVWFNEQILSKYGWSESDE